MYIRIDLKDGTSIEDAKQLANSIMHESFDVNGVFKQLSIFTEPPTSKIPKGKLIEQDPSSEMSRKISG